MELAIQILSYAVGLPLQILTISALMRGAWQQYPFVFAYVTGSFLATVTQMPMALNYAFSGRPTSGDLVRMHVRVYWVSEGVLQILILAVVIGFIYAATGKLQSRQTIRSLLLMGAILFAGISFFVHYVPPLEWRTVGRWMTPWTRDLQVCSTFLDLALWAMLIASRQKDRLLLLLTGAMGIMFTGAAIGGSIRSMAIANKQETVAFVGSTIIVLADNVFLYLWWQAFRRLPVKRKQLA